MWGSSITFQDYPLEQTLDIMTELGFTRIEMWKHHLHRCMTADLRRDFARYAASRGISMGGLNVVGEDYYRPFGSSDEFARTLQGLKNDVDYALSLGSSDVLVWEGVRPGGTSDDECMEKLLPRLIDLFQQAISYSAPKKIRFLVEPHPFTVGMLDTFMISLCDALPPEFFGITFDFCHYGVGRKHDYIDAVRHLGNRIRHIHLSDSDLLSSELHFAPGDGLMDIPALIRAFCEIRYNGTIALDLYGNPIPVDSARRAAPIFTRIFEQLSMCH
jgi:sugar phosphate isomerase/epimerase